MPHAFYFALGPCQDWIKTSRKGRDLWFSSWLLSELARAAAGALVEREGKKALVVPTIEDFLDQESSIPNKVLAVLEHEQPAALAAKMEAAVRERLRSLALAAFARVKGDFDREAALAQVLDLPELSWAAVAYAGPEGYADARRRGEALLNARKETRPFAPPSWASEMPKSMLDGARESVIPERVFGPGKTGMPLGELRRQFHVGQGERLCGLGLLKRLGEATDDEDPSEVPGSRVQSTSHVAAWRTRDAIRKLGDEGRDAFLGYVNRLKRAGLAPEELLDPYHTDALHKYDAHILFVNRLHDLLPSGLADRKGSDAALREAAEAHSQLFKDLSRIAAEKRLPRPRPPKPYYAVLDADGDHLGATLAELKTAEQNRQLSEATTAFAAEARRIIKEQSGHTVYAGGDDLLALVPVEKVLACADALRQQFARTIQPVVRKLLPGHQPLPTLSAGIAVGHHTDPLQDTLEAARNAQEVAKQDEGRDAWCVTVLKRGGAPVRASGKWARLGDLLALQELLTDDDEGLSRGLPYELQAVRARLDDKKLAELWSLEVKRILLQKGLSRTDKTFETVRDQMKSDGGDPLPLANRMLVARALTGLEGGDE